MINGLVSVLIMFVEIVCAQFVFLPFFKRREKFALRLSGALVVSAEIIIWLWLLYQRVNDEFFVYDGDGVSVGGANGAFKVFYYLTVFALTLGCMAFCFKGSFWKILFYGSGGYALQHLSMNLAAAINYPFGFPDSSFLPYITEFAVCLVLFVSVYFLFVRGKESYDNDRTVRMKSLIAVVVIIICIGLSRITTDNPDRGEVSFFAETMYAVIGCFLVLCLLLSISRSDKILNEVEMMDELFRFERKQYSLSKESIDIINIKCHDLKHQIKALKDSASAEEIQKIGDAIMVYDSAVKTGNDILDVILTEKNLLCENKNITLTCMLNGENLSFMDNMDIYSLFGNALSNAMESVSKIAQAERRCISVTSKKIGDIFSVHIENYYDGELVFEDGLPQTSGDRAYHGFGMKSMQRIAEKYGGFMNVKAENGKFLLDFIFPPSQKGGGRKEGEKA